MKLHLRVIIGLVLLLLSQASHAQNLPPAISPYVRETIARSEKGIAYAWTVESAMRFTPLGLGGWMREVTGFVTHFVDTDVRIVQQRQNLLLDSACLRADEILLELQMEKVRGEFKKALASQSITAIFVLEDVMKFLNTRYEMLLRGAKDPAFEDAAWHKRWSFEPEVEMAWCCPAEDIGNTCAQVDAATCAMAGGEAFETLNECTAYGCEAPAQKTEAAVCPFHSDYLPPSLNGYGCDAETLFGLLTGMPDSPFTDAAIKELEALTTLQRAMEAAGGMGNLAGGIAGGLNPDDLKRKHVSRFGCVIGGVCEANMDITCAGPDECPGKSRCIDARSVGQCDKNPDNICLDNNDCPSNGQCRRLSDAMKIELRGPFSLERNHSGLLEAFRLLRREDGANRMQSEALTPANNKELLTSTVARYLRSQFVSFNTEQGEKEAMTFAVGSDPLLSAGTTFDELHKSVAELGRLAGSKEGIRSFVKDFAYFLRRSCLDRPCNLRLDRIIKIVLRDECFPYVSGAFTSNTEQNPAWKRCMDAAGITELR